MAQHSSVTKPATDWGRSTLEQLGSSSVLRLRHELKSVTKVHSPQVKMRLRRQTSLVSHWLQLMFNRQWGPGLTTWPHACSSGCFDGLHICTTRRAASFSQRRKPRQLETSLIKGKNLVTLHFQAQIWLEVSGCLFPTWSFNSREA